MANKLTPCPFCGGESEIEQCENITYNANGKARIYPYTAIYCVDCGAGIEEQDKEELVDKWNTRTPEIKQWHIMPDGDLPEPSKIVELTVEKDDVRSVHIGTIDDTSEDWFYIDESDEDCCDRTGGDDVLAWRELSDPWEGSGRKPND